MYRKFPSFAQLLFILTALLPLSQQSYGQQYWPMYRPGEVVTLWAGCRGFPGGQLIVNCPFDLYVNAYDVDSNGHTISRHSHPNGTPSSGIRTPGGIAWVKALTNLFTDSFGKYRFELGAGHRDIGYGTDVRRMVAHEEVLTVYPHYGISAIYNYAVGYANQIFWVEEKPEWIHVGARVEHMGSNSYNHWMAETAAWGIWYAAVEFLNLHPAQGRIAVNDMALPFGGLFDINGGWEPSHWNHGRGTAVDVRGNGALYSIPNSQQDEFIAICVAKGAYYGQVEFPGTSNQHIHCQWPDP